MFVSTRQLLHGMDVQTPFMRECRQPDIRRANIVRNIRQFIHKDGKLTKKTEIRDQLHPELQLQRWNEGREIAVTHSFAIAVYRSLHLHGAGPDRCESVRDTESAIIVGVNSDGDSDMRDCSFGHLPHKLRERAAIGITKHDKIGARLVRRFDRRQRVVGILAEAVEKMLRIVEDLPPAFLEKTDRIGDHAKIFFQAHAEDLRDMQRPCLTHDGHDGRFRIEKHLHLRIFFDPHSTTARHSKGRNFRMFPFALRRFLEERRIFGVRARPTALNIIDSKGIQLLGNTNLVEHRE